MQPLTRFLATTVGMEQEMFVSLFTHPFVVTSKRHLQKIQSLNKADFPLQNQDRFSTMISNVRSNKMEKDWLRAAWICPIKKEGGGEMQMVNLGRTSNNDIVIPLPVVSKFHCCFIIYGPGEVYMIDGGSTNGTFLTDIKMTPNEKTPLKSGDLIRFGSQLEFEFYFPTELWSELSSFSAILSG